jgi:hypothetical protein
LGDFDIAVTVAGEVNFDVRNPAGNEAPGITKKVNGFTDVTIDKSAIQNGNYNFTIYAPMTGGTVLYALGHNIVRPPFSC